MEAKKAYDLWASTYDSVKNKTRDLEALAAQSTIGKLQFRTVVVLGCGTGKNIRWLENCAESIIGFDLSQDMLVEARKTISSENVQLIQADITKPWQISDAHAGLISCSLTLEHIQDLTFVFKEASRVLKNGGFFYVCELHPFKQYHGSQAKFETDGEEIEIQVFTHHFSEYLEAGKNSGLTLHELKEWFDNNEEGKIPRLVSFVFQKESS